MLAFCLVWAIFCACDMTWWRRRALTRLHFHLDGVDRTQVDICRPLPQGWLSACYSGSMKGWHHFIIIVRFKCTWSPDVLFGNYQADSRMTQALIEKELGTHLLVRTAFFNQNAVAVLLDAGDKDFKSELAKVSWIMCHFIIVFRLVTVCMAITHTFRGSFPYR